MPRRVAIIHGHPDQAGSHLCHALADAYAESAAAAGHEVTRIEVARLAFPILRTQEDFEHGHLPDSLVEARGRHTLGAASRHGLRVMARDDAGAPQGLPRAGDAPRCRPRISQVLGPSVSGAVCPQCGGRGLNSPADSTRPQFGILTTRAQFSIRSAANSHIAPFGRLRTPEPIA